MSAARSSCRHLPSRLNLICPVGPRPLPLVTLQLKLRVASVLPELSVPCTLGWYCPLADGQPEIRPQESIDRPAGRPGAANVSVQPASESAAGTVCTTGVPTDAAVVGMLPTLTAPWTCQEKPSVTVRAPFAVAVISEGNVAGFAG